MPSPNLSPAAADGRQQYRPDVAAQEHPASRPRRGNVWAGAFIVAFLAPHLAALVVPFEEFPYTSAPMFAQYVGPDTPRYRLRFVAESRDGGAEREIAPSHLGVQGVPFSRDFFGRVYGSTDPVSPFGHHRGDTREAFEARLSDFFGRVTLVLARRDPARWAGLTGIRLEAVRLTPVNRDTEVHVVGRYAVASHHFTHTWGRQP